MKMRQSTFLRIAFGKPARGGYQKRILIAAAGGDLDAYMLTELNRAVDGSGEDGSDQTDNIPALNFKRPKNIGTR